MEFAAVGGRLVVEPAPHSFSFLFSLRSKLGGSNSDEAPSNRIAANSERERERYRVRLCAFASCHALPRPTSITLLFIRPVNKACYPRYALIGWKVDWHGFNHENARELATVECVGSIEEEKLPRRQKKKRKKKGWTRTR